ncbi:Sialin [Toxocara canis]|uniref:Sialin n=1 Tax=Toxocara canis TaxID=6265 RepID=A0A0B2W4F7_TOXCA|nr:Sialin [Toxocara canis]
MYGIDKRMDVAPIEKKVPTANENESSEMGKKEKMKMAHRTRYFILILTSVCLSFVMSNIVVFNFTVLCMTRHHDGELPLANESLLDVQHSGYTKHEKTIIFSSVAVGALLAVLPGTYAIQAYGARWTFFAAGLLTGIATAAVPWAASKDTLSYFVFLRMLQGVSFAACLPIAGVVTSNWASLKQHGLFMAALTAFGQLSVVFSMPVSGQLCISRLGWPSVYYLHSLISFITFTIWVIVYRNLPAKHPLVDNVELEKISRGRSSCDLEGLESRLKSEKRIPYLKIISTPAIWGIWIAAIGDLCAIQLIHTFSPQYIREVLGYSVRNTGLSAALPVFFQFLVKMFAGHSSDKIHCISETTKLRLYNSIALGVSALFMIALAFVPEGHPVIGIALMTLSTSMFGFNGGGFNKCATLVSRQYSQFVLGNIQLLWCVAMLICPIIVNSLLGEGTISEWRKVYLLHAAILLITNAIFCVLATAKPASWTGEEALPSRSRSMNSKTNMSSQTHRSVDQTNGNIATTKSPTSNYQNSLVNNASNKCVC